MGAPPLLDPLPTILTLGSLNLLAGASGVGKTALMAGMAVQFRDGHPLFGRPTNRPPLVGYISADHPWAGTRHWFDAVGFPDIPQYSLVDDYTLAVSKIRQKLHRTKLLTDCIAHLAPPPGSLIFIDPIALFLGGNLLDYDAVAIACIEIHRFAKAAQLCLIGLVHSGKQKTNVGDRYLRAQDRISGTMALLGYTETQMYLMAPEEVGPKATTHQFNWNPHHAPAQAFNLSRDEMGRFVGLADGYPGDPDHDLHLEYDAETKRILASLPDAPAHTSTVALIAHHCYGADAIPRRTLFRKLALLVKRGEVAQPARGQWQRTGPTPAN